MLAGRFAVGLELAARTGAPAQAAAAAHHRVRTRHGRPTRDRSEAGTGTGVWRAHRRIAVEGRTLLGARLHPPARWRAALSSRQDAVSHGTAPRSEWQFACALQRQDP